MQRTDPFAEDLLRHVDSALACERILVNLQVACSTDAPPASGFYKQTIAEILKALDERRVFASIDVVDLELSIRSWL